MRSFLIFTLISFLGCTAPSSTDTSPDTKETEPVKHKPLKVPRLRDLSPSNLAFVNAYPRLAFDADIADTADTDTGPELPTMPDADDTTEAEPDETVLNCDLEYSFSDCCGDGTCQPDESAFFCPADCP